MEKPLFKSIHAGAIVLALSSSLVVGVASAEPAPLPDVTRPFDTRGCTQKTIPPLKCLHLTIALNGMTINSVPNMAATPFSREAFLTGAATAVISGDGPAGTDGLNGARVTLGTQIGCQAVVDQNQSISTGSVGLSPSATVGGIGATNAAGAPAVPVLGVTNGTPITLPNGTVYVKAGDNTFNTLSEMTVGDLKDGNGKGADLPPDKSSPIVLRAVTSDSRIGPDQCAGPVTVRMIASVKVATTDSVQDATIYSAIIQI